MFSGRNPQPRAAAAGRESQVPITYVPFRNAHFLAVAVSWAEVVGASTILIGKVKTPRNPSRDPGKQSVRKLDAGSKVPLVAGDLEVAKPGLGARRRLPAQRLPALR